MACPLALRDEKNRLEEKTNCSILADQKGKNEKQHKLHIKLSFTSRIHLRIVKL